MNSCNCFPKSIFKCHFSIKYLHMCMSVKKKTQQQRRRRRRRHTNKFTNRPHTILWSFNYTTILKMNAMCCLLDFWLVKFYWIFSQKPVQIHLYVYAIYSHWNLESEREIQLPNEKENPTNKQTIFFLFICY